MLISSGRVSTTTLAYVVSVATRIINDRGQTVGVMVINLSLDKFTSICIQFTSDYRRAVK